MRIKSFFINSHFFEDGKLDQSKLGDKRNCYSIHNRYFINDKNLSEQEYNVENFKCFLEIVKAETEKGDTRPICIFDFFDRLDEAVDITPFLEPLSALGRQVFVGVSEGYPIERIES